MKEICGKSITWLLHFGRTELTSFGLPIRSSTPLWNTDSVRNSSLIKRNQRFFLKVSRLIKLKIVVFMWHFGNPYFIFRRYVHFCVQISKKRTRKWNIFCIVRINISSYYYWILEPFHRYLHLARQPARTDESLDYSRFHSLVTIQNRNYDVHVHSIIL